MTERASRLRNMKCAVHDLEIMGSNLGQVELGVLSASVEVVLEPKTSCKYMHHIHVQLARLVYKQNPLCFPHNMYTFYFMYSK